MPPKARTRGGKAPSKLGDQRNAAKAMATAASFASLNSTNLSQFNIAVQAAETALRESDFVAADAAVALARTAYTDGGSEKVKSLSALSRRIARARKAAEGAVPPGMPVQSSPVLPITLDDLRKHGHIDASVQALATAAGPDAVTDVVLALICALSDLGAASLVKFNLTTSSGSTITAGRIIYHRFETLDGSLTGGVPFCAFSLVQLKPGGVGRLTVARYLEGLRRQMIIPNQRQCCSSETFLEVFEQLLTQCALATMPPEIYAQAMAGLPANFPTASLPSADSGISVKIALRL